MKKKQQQMIQAVCIFAVILNKKMWIMDQSTRYDNLYLPHYTDQQEKAKPFEDEVTARQYIQQIAPIKNRKFDCETFLVPAIAFIPGKLGSTIKPEPCTSSKE